MGSLPVARSTEPPKAAQGLTPLKENHMTSPAKQIAIDRAAQKVEDAHQATTAAQEAEPEERAALAEIKATPDSVFYDDFGEIEVIRQ